MVNSTSLFTIQTVPMYVHVHRLGHFFVTTVGTGYQLLVFVFLPAGILGMLPGQLSEVVAGKLVMEHADRLRTDLSYQIWRLRQTNKDGIQTNELRQFAWPWVWRSKLRLSGIDAKIMVASRLATMQKSDPDGMATKQQILGLGDTQIAMDYQFQRSPRSLRNWYLGLGLSIPTGKSQLQPTQADLANQFYSEILNFKVSRLGEGFNVNGSLFATYKFDVLQLAIGGNYLAKGQYQVLPGKIYNPGNELQFQTVTLWQGQIAGWQNSFGVRGYSPDRFDQQIWFQQGIEVLANSILTFRFPKGQIFIEHQLTHRLKNHQLEGQQFGLQLRNTNNNLRRSAFGGRYRVSPVTQVKLQYERLFTLPNENKMGRSTIRSTSFETAIQFQDHLWANFGIGFGQGEIVPIDYQQPETESLAGNPDGLENRIQLNGFSFWIGLRQQGIFDSD